MDGIPDTLAGHLPRLDALPANDSDSYGISREEAAANRREGWRIDLKRQGQRIVRLFKDSVYGSPAASLEQAKAYRDAVISALPPLTNHEQAVRLRTNNRSGISGVRRIETPQGDAWEAGLVTRAGSKRKIFSVEEHGEEKARALAIATRQDMLNALPVKHLTYARHAEELTQEHFARQLAQVPDVMPYKTLSEAEVMARIEAVNARFDALRPLRLRVRLRHYCAGKLALCVSDAGHPAKRKLTHVNIRRLDPDAIRIQATAKIEATIADIYNAGVARWFMKAHGDKLLDPERYEPETGFNVLVFVPRERMKPRQAG